MKDRFAFANKRMIYTTLLVMLVSVAALLTSFAFFNFTRTGDVNQITTGQINFEFDDYEAINIGNAFPISMNDIDNNYESNFTLTAHTTIPDGIRYKIYAVVGDSEANKTRLLDSVMSLKFDAPEDGDGFTTMINNYKDAKSPVFVNGEALISTGIVKDTEDLTEKSYKISLWIDSDKISVSSTTKRAINAEGNPSLADTSTGNVTADRYIQNDNNLVNTTLYPALERQEGKIIYTTKEFATSYYSIKIVVEAEEVVENEELVYFDTKGGTVSTETKMVTVGSAYGELPTPTRSGYTFKGWNGKNLFNKDDVLNGYEINYTGVEQNSNWFVTGYIRVDFNSVYTISGKSAGVYILYYDSNKKVVSNSTNGLNGVITIPNIERISFVRLNGYLYHKSTFQFEEGSVATAYEPYYVTNEVNVTQEKDHVLKAIWQPNTYNIVFNANGGTGTMESQEMTYDKAANLTENAFTRIGYTFLGWSTTANGNVEYSNQASILNLATTGNFNLYAIWQQNS